MAAPDAAGRAAGRGGRDGSRPGARPARRATRGRGHLHARAHAHAASSRPTPTPSPTPNFAELVANSNANAALRPGHRLSAGSAHLRSGATYRITGQNEDGNWWQISLRRQDGWVTGDLVSVRGNTEAVAVVEVAPPPTAAPAAGRSPPHPPRPRRAPRALIPRPRRLLSATACRRRSYGGADLGYVVNATRGMGFNWVKFQVPWKDFEGSKGAYGWGGMDQHRRHAGRRWHEHPGLHREGAQLGATRQHRPQRRRAARQSAGLRRLRRRATPPATRAGSRPSRSGTSRTCGTSGATSRWTRAATWTCCAGPTGRSRPRIRAWSSSPARSPPPASTTARPPSTTWPICSGCTLPGAKRCFDAVGAHPSGYNNPPDAKFGYSNPAEPSFKNHPSFFFRDTMERYREVMVANGDAGKRVWPTEFGWASEGEPRPRLRIRPRHHGRRAGAIPGRAPIR